MGQVQMPRGPAVASRNPKVVKIPVVTEMNENPTANEASAFSVRVKAGR